jgi:glycosyltransferase involved in cell wall biosynthesis
MKEINEPKVSVLMPVFNGLPFLKDAIESILSQTFCDFEFIIVDDGSTDGTADLLSDYEKKDKRIKVFKNTKNKGIVFSLNRGLKECSGYYIARMDSDDIALKERFNKQVSIMDSDYSIGALGTAILYIDADGKHLDVVRRCRISGSNLTETPLLHPTVMIRKSHLDNHGLTYQEKYRFSEDYFLWLQLSKIAKISAIDNPLLKYRLNGKATKIRNLKKTIWSTLKVKKDAVFILKITPGIKDIFRAFLEVLLLFLPTNVILYLYLKITFRKKQKINL